MVRQAPPSQSVGGLQAGPSTPQPDFSEVDRQPLNAAIMALFRRKMVQALGEDVQESG